MDICPVCKCMLNNNSCAICDYKFTPSTTTTVSSSSVFDIFNFLDDRKASRINNMDLDENVYSSNLKTFDGSYKNTINQNIKQNIKNVDFYKYEENSNTCLDNDSLDNNFDDLPTKSNNPYKKFQPVLLIIGFFLIFINPFFGFLVFLLNSFIFGDSDGKKSTT